CLFGLFFFFQAEDGIRDDLVTGVQTCALPILALFRIVSTPAAAAGSQEGYYTKESWAFSGYATPEAALQSAIWAMREGDTRTLLASMAPQEVARMQNEWANKSEAKISADAKRGTDKISSIRVLESRRLSDD